MRARNSDRRKRTPFGVPRLKMNVDDATMNRLKAENKVPRWINDVDNRIAEAQAGDYEFVASDIAPVKTGDKEEVAEQDRRIRKIVGKHKDGSPMYSYFMAIPKDYYDEDQRAKEDINRKVDEAIKGGNPAGLDHHNIAPDKGASYVKSVDYQP